VLVRKEREKRLSLALVEYSRYAGNSTGQAEAPEWNGKAKILKPYLSQSHRGHRKKTKKPESDISLAEQPRWNRKAN
jgi:hypothetical protein